MLNLVVFRTNLTSNYTEGVMIDSDKLLFLCDTVEDKVRDLNKDGKQDTPKIYGLTAIPYGKYNIEVTFSPKFQKDMVLVNSVPEFEGIRLHWAVDAGHLLGCVGCGKRSGPGTLSNSGMTDKLTSMLRESGGVGTLTIK
jgi:hypothetical protein